MPIYEYRCSDCGFQDDFLQKLSEPPMTLCPSCGKESLKKLLSAAGFQLKGSGWYATDFKSSGSKPADKSGGTTKPSNKGGDGASESKSTEGKSSGDTAAGNKTAGDSGASSTPGASSTSKAPPVSASN